MEYKCILDLDDDILVIILSNSNNILVNKVCTKFNLICLGNNIKTYSYKSKIHFDDYLKNVFPETNINSYGFKNYNFLKDKDLLLDIFNEPDDNFIKFVIKRINTNIKMYILYLRKLLELNKTEVVKFLIENKKINGDCEEIKSNDYHKYMIHIPIEKENKDILEYMISNNFKFTNRCYLIAYQTGGLEYVKYLRSIGCELYYNILYDFVDYSYEIIDWLIENNAWFSDNLFYIYFKKDYELIEYIYKKGCPLNKDLFALASSYLNFEMMVWLKENNCPSDYTVFKNVLKYEDRRDSKFEIIKWLYKNNFKINDEHLSIVMKYEDIEIIEWFFENVKDNTHIGYYTDCGIYDGSYEKLLFLINNIPDEYLLSCAFRNIDSTTNEGKILIDKLIIKNCPLDFDTYSQNSDEFKSYIDNLNYLKHDCKHYKKNCYISGKKYCLKCKYTIPFALLGYSGEH